jgi:hypothetical protein
MEIVMGFLHFQKYGKTKRNKILAYLNMMKIIDKRPLLNNVKTFLKHPAVRNEIYRVKDIDLSKYKLTVIQTVDNTRYFPIIRISYDRGYVAVKINKISPV